MPTILTPPASYSFNEQPSTSAETRTIGLTRFIALTYVPTFFHKLGFQTVAMDTLPEKVWGVCVKCYKYNNCDETAVLLELK